MLISDKLRRSIPGLVAGRSGSARLTGCRQLLAMPVALCAGARESWTFGMHVGTKPCACTSTLGCAYLHDSCASRRRWNGGEGASREGSAFSISIPVAGLGVDLLRRPTDSGLALVWHRFVGALVRA
eukprot:scaffold196_cov371-Prasinococcus_capsulatus_cf.AAC.25